jgi:signal transduction histidine kinase
MTARRVATTKRKCVHAMRRAQRAGMASPSLTIAPATSLPTTGRQAVSGGAPLWPIVEWRFSRRWLELAGMAIVLAGLYAGGALLTFALLENPAAGAAFFPAAGLTLGVLVLYPGAWPLWLVAVGSAELIVDLAHGQTVAMAAGFAIANSLEPLAGALGIRRFSHGGHGRDDFVVFLTFGVLVGTLCGAIIGATTATLFGGAGSWVTVLGNWWLGDALGVVVVGTLLLAWARPSPFEPVAHPVELVALVVVAVGITLVPALAWHHPIIYAVLPILTWAAVRGGLRAVTLAGAAVALATNWAVLTGHASDLVVVGTERTRLVLIQIFLGLTLLTSAFLAVEIAERRRVELLARRADERRAAAERDAARSADVARHQIALEAHDIVGHALSVMLLQAGAARRVIDQPVAAQRLLSSIEEVGRAAFHDLDRALALTDPGRSAGPRLDRVGDLVTLLHETGMDITLDLGPGFTELPEAVDRAAYRIVQEALTNVLKHAPGSHVEVCIDRAPQLLFISVSNTLTLEPELGNVRPGRGLQGIHDRVGTLLGHVTAGTVGDRFVVCALLPLEPVSTR